MRKKQILFRATDLEYLQIKTMATTRKMRTATFIREALLRGITPTIPQINQTTLAELQRIGNNLNQLAKSLNTTGYTDIKEAQKQIAELRFYLIEARKPT